jgi:NADH:ubiquinone oxidoreductase subunit E
MNNKKVGAVLIVGGGIGGIQAGLDLANSGFKVYLLEKTPSIGGVMAQLDKTFPTNDCSMCILAPKLVATGRHPNIELITNAEIDTVSGEAGNFLVAVKKKPRYVDEDKCTGCGVCMENCPVRKVMYEVEDEPVILKEGDLQKIERIITEHRGEKNILMPILQDINSEYHYLPQDVLMHVSQELHVPMSTVYNIATFYNAFSLTPKGRYIISVCLGTTCYVRGAERIVHKIEEELGITVGETTKDLKFSLETVRCLGCCSLAPVIRIAGETYGRLRPNALPKILGEYD